MSPFLKWPLERRNRQFETETLTGTVLRVAVRKSWDHHIFNPFLGCPNALNKTRALIIHTSAVKLYGPKANARPLQKMKMEETDYVEAKPKSGNELVVHGSISASHELNQDLRRLTGRDS